MCYENKVVSFNGENKKSLHSAGKSLCVREVTSLGRRLALVGESQAEVLDTALAGEADAGCC